MPRYKCVAEAYGRWMVWDEQNEVAATLGGKPLIGLPKYRAETARDILENIEIAEIKITRG